MHDFEEHLALWAAVLQTAIEDIHRATKHRYSSEQRASAAWLASDSKEPRSFLWVCDMLNADPNKVRSLCHSAQCVNNPLEG